MKLEAIKAAAVKAGKSYTTIRGCDLAVLVREAGCTDPGLLKTVAEFGESKERLHPPGKTIRVLIAKIEGVEPDPADLASDDDVLKIERPAPADEDTVISDEPK